MTISDLLMAIPNLLMEIKHKNESEEFREAYIKKKTATTTSNQIEVMKRCFIHIYFGSMMVRLYFRLISLCIYLASTLHCYSISICLLWFLLNFFFLGKTLYREALNNSRVVAVGRIKLNVRDIHQIMAYLCSKMSPSLHNFVTIMCNSNMNVRSKQNKWGELLFVLLLPPPPLNYSRVPNSPVNVFIHSEMRIIIHLIRVYSKYHVRALVSNMDVDD